MCAFWDWLFLAWQFSIIAGHLCNRLSTLKLYHYLYLEFPIVTPPRLLHVHPSIGPHRLTHCLLGGVQSNIVTNFAGV